MRKMTIFGALMLVSVVLIAGCTSQPAANNTQPPSGEPTTTQEPATPPPAQPAAQVTTDNPLGQSITEAESLDADLDTSELNSIDADLADIESTI